MPVDGLPLRHGSEGEAVKDVQRRLIGLGFEVAPDEVGTFGEGTLAAVRAFQEARGLRPDAVCGPETWTALVEAGYRLGDRPLYLAHPLLRGDDVADLQRRLGALGFDAGRVDGIFGPRTEMAVADFQRNAGLVTDAICGPATVAALARITRGGESLSGIAAVRELERLREGPRSLAGRVIAVGERGGAAALCAAVSRILDGRGGAPVVVATPDPSAQADEANASGADAYVGLAVAPAGPLTVAYYRAPSGWESPAGRALAEAVHEALEEVLGRVEVRGMTLPTLRETRMPAVLVELGPGPDTVEQSPAVAAAVVTALERWVLTVGAR